MICKDCNSNMKQLFSSFYCPNDCDKKTAVTQQQNSDEIVYINPNSYIPGIHKYKMIATCSQYKTMLFGDFVTLKIKSFSKKEGTNSPCCVTYFDCEVEVID